MKQLQHTIKPSVEIISVVQLTNNLMIDTNLGFNLSNYYRGRPWSSKHQEKFNRTASAW